MEHHKPSHSTTVKFHCWNCSADAELDLREIQKERIAKNITEVKPATDGIPKKCFVRCPSCNKWNTIHI